MTSTIPTTESTDVTAESDCTTTDAAQGVSSADTAWTEHPGRQCAQGSRHRGPCSVAPMSVANQLSQIAHQYSRAAELLSAHIEALHDDPFMGLPQSAAKGFHYPTVHTVACDDEDGPYVRVDWWTKLVHSEHLEAQAITVSTAYSPEHDGSAFIDLPNDLWLIQANAEGLASALTEAVDLMKRLDKVAASTTP